MSKENEINPFRFNQSKINSTKQNVPTTINWETLKKVLSKKESLPKSLWGFVQDQQNKDKK